MNRINSYFARLICQSLDLTPNQIQPLLTGSQLTPEQVFQESDMPLDDFILLLNNALSFSQNPALGLTFGAHAQPYLIGDLSFAGINAPTLMDSLIGLVNYSALQADYIEFELESTLGGLLVRAHVKTDLGPTIQTQNEVLVLVLQNYLELFLNRPFTQGRYFFSYSPPSYADQYRNVMHCPVAFNCEHTGVLIPNHLLATPSIFFDDSLWQLGKMKCAQQLQAMNNRYRNLYTQTVLSKLNGNPPPLMSLHDMAVELNISERTLNRRLMEEGTHFRDLHNQAFLNWSKTFLSDSNMSVESISTEMGYMDSANFRRAFKKLTNMTPMEFRKSH